MVEDRTTAVSRKITFTLSDPRALDIVDSIAEENLSEEIGAYIVIGQMVLSHTVIATGEGVAQALFAALSINDLTMCNSVVGQARSRVAVSLLKAKVDSVGFLGNA
jgi:hypothetical protein